MARLLPVAVLGGEGQLMGGRKTTQRQPPGSRQEVLEPELEQLLGQPRGGSGGRRGWTLGQTRVAFPSLPGWKEDLL